MAREMQKDDADKRLGDDMDGSTLLQHVLETMGGGLFTVDVEGNITSWNRGMEEITGYTPEEVVGKPCALLEGNECFRGPHGEHRERCPLFANEFKTFRFSRNISSPKFVTGIIFPSPRLMKVISCSCRVMIGRAMSENYKM